MIAIMYWLNLPHKIFFMTCLKNECSGEDMAARIHYTGGLTTLTLELSDTEPQGLTRSGIVTSRKTASYRLVFEKISQRLELEITCGKHTECVVRRFDFHFDQSGNTDVT